MDLQFEFQKLEEGQNKILQMVMGMQKQASKQNSIYSIDDLAKIFKVTNRTIYNWKDKGLLSFVQIGSKTYFTSMQLEDFLNQNEVKSLNGRRW